HRMTDAQPATADRQVLHYSNHSSYGIGSSSAEALGAEFFHRGWRQSWLTHCHYAAAHFPLCPEFVGTRGHDRIGIALPIKLACNLGHTSEMTDVGVFIGCRRVSHDRGSRRSLCRS